MRKIRVLSIDGGGIRGIIPAVILHHLEKSLQRRVGSDVRLTDFFELSGGTSTGAILASGLLTPGPDGRPRYSTDDLLKIYLTLGPKIFHRTLFWTVTRLNGLIGPKYPADGLEEVLKGHFGDLTLDRMLKPCLISGYDIHRRRTLFFNSVLATSPETNFLVRRLIRATTAAPTYFPPARIHSEAGKEFATVDGGTFANNPAMCLFVEALKDHLREFFKDDGLPKSPRPEEMLLLSIGTGLRQRRFDYQQTRWWGALQWLEPLLDILMHGHEEVVHHQLEMAFRDCPGNYVRLQPDLGKASSKMDNYREENIEALKRTAVDFVRNEAERIEQLTENLVESGKVSSPVEA